LRVKATPSVTLNVLQLLYQWFLRSPRKFNPELLTSIWTTIIGFGSDESRSKLLQNIFEFLDRFHGRHTRLIVFDIWKTVISFLGENAHILAKEDQFSSGNSSRIQNETMKNILLKLECAAVSSSWELRIITLEVLAKIAFRSNNAIRLRIYEFITLVCRDPSTSLSSTGLPILNILDHIFEAQLKWNSKIKEGKLTSEEVNSLRSENDALLSFVELYCKIPIPFSPIHPSVCSLISIK